MDKQEFLERLEDPEPFVAREAAAEFLWHIQTCNLKYSVWVKTNTNIATYEVRDLNREILHDLDVVFTDYAYQFGLPHLFYITRISDHHHRYQIKKGQRRG